MSSLFPEQFDSNDNLYLVHDSLRLRLAEDYTPGDVSISIQPDDEIFGKFPNIGLITLTDQCSDIKERAISFKYTSKGNNTFDGLELLDGFTDVAKSKSITDVTQNVMAAHHNQLKDAVIAIEGFAGTKGETSTVPLEGSMEGRTNYLRNLVLKPKAWFDADKKIGIIPLCINFEDFSVRDPEFWLWDFGSGGTYSISRTDVVVSGDISKCFYVPGIYPVTLTVTNDFGSDSVTIPDFVTVRAEAPDPATITFAPTSQQIYSDGILRARANQLITILIDSTGAQTEDPIERWIWELNDDLEHDNSTQITASYSVGGIYDVKLKAETELGAYRITTFEDVIDIVEKYNIWHFIFNSTSTVTTKTVYAYEFGLLSETYKAAHTSTSLSVTRDAGFLDGVPEYNQQFREFRRNNGFTGRNTTASGLGGAGLLYWSEGGANSASTHTIKFREFNGFDNTWSTPVINGSGDTINRQWNWVAWNSSSNVYFVLGAPGPGAFTGSPTNQTFKSLSLSNYNTSNISFASSNYLNGADELMSNVGSDGDFSVYRSTWKDSTGYLVRNDGTGSFFRLKSFYRSEGTVSDPLQYIRKLTDMPGATKFEGQMVALSGGIYFFNNTGEVLLYNTTTNVWGVGGPGINSPAFASLQDSDVSGYDSSSNTLVAVSDQSTKAYLFFDYSVKAQMRFNETDMTFTSLPVRPSGEQFVAGLY